MSPERIGVVAAAGAAVVFGIAYPATAIALRSFSPLGVAALQCSLGLLAVVGLAATGVIGRPALDGLPGPRLTRLVLLAALGGTGFIVAVNLAVAAAGPTVTGFVATLYAVLATVFAIPLLREPVRPPVLLAFGLALVGTALMAGVEPVGTAGLGIVLAFVAATCYGLFLVLARRWGPPYRLDGTLVTIGVLVGRGPILMAVELVREPAALVPASPDLAALVALAVLVVGPAVAGQLLVLASVRRVPARTTSASLLLTPIASAVVGWIVVGATLEPLELVGAAILLGSMGVASGAVDQVRRWATLSARQA